MASIMATFATADRRKKVVTYGKKSRPSTTPAPPPGPAEEPPSPDRPRKHVAPNDGGSKSRGGALKAAKALQHTRANGEDYDIFQVPSDDEFTIRPVKHAKRVSKHGTKEAHLTTPIADAEPATCIRRQDRGHAPEKVPKPKIAKPAVPDEMAVRNSDRLPALTRKAPQKAERTIVPPVRRAKTPQPTQDLNEDEAVQQPVVNSKTVSRAKTPAMTTAKAAPATTLIKPTSKPAKKAPDRVDVYDMRSSDDEVAVPLRKPLRIGRNPEAKYSANQPQKSTEEPLKNTAESDDSNASRKRKRRGSFSSVTTSKTPVDRKPDLSAPQRSRKLQRKEHRVSPGYEASTQSRMVPAPPRTALGAPAINKPKRTRQYTVPVLAQRTMGKGQSSPAQLSGMLPGTAAKPSPIPEASESPSMEDETMYEIRDQLTTPVRPSKSIVSGTVTPRQKALFSSLLGDSSSRTPMPSLASLTLTDQKPRTMLGALSRSKSDLTYSAQARKTRLIDTLKNEDASSEDDEDMDVSNNESEASSDQSSSEESTGPGRSGKWADHLEEAQISVDVYTEDIDIESEPAAESQTSQATSAFGSRARFTYAKTRSYLEEANPEDALLILDDDLGFDSQTKDGLSGDEEDPVSQVQATHVLKRKGQQHTFNDDVRMYIDDLPVASGNTVRRSAILELCSKMEDESFTNQLLDSTLANKFFGNMHCNGEIIFDVVTAVVVIFILKANSTNVVLDQIYQTGIVASLVKLTSNDADILGIAKNRKTNLSRIAVDSVTKFHAQLLVSSLFSHHTRDKLTPQLVALKALDSLVVGLRRSGSNDALLNHGMVSSLIDVASKTCTRIKDGKAAVDDSAVVHYVVSILESVSTSRQKQALWPVTTLERLAELMPVVVGVEDASSKMLTIKLCMNLTNNKPKACLPFSGQGFVQPLVAAVIQHFARLRSELTQEERTTVLETLILTLGALINLAEFSDRARSNVDDGQQMISTLVKIFLEGSERAAQAQSMEESQSNVPVGYLTVLVGNLCLNRSIRSKVCAQLPEQRLDVLLTKIREFVQYHEHVDSKTKPYEGAEGRETWQNYTARLMLVVERLEKAEK